MSKFLMEDVVLVNNSECCEGYPEGTTCKVIGILTELDPVSPSGEGLTLYRLRPVENNTRHYKAEFVACDNCLELIERIEENSYVK